MAGRLGCGGGGDGRDSLAFAASRLALAAAAIGGGGILELAGRREPGVASSGGLDAGLLEAARDAVRAGVAEPPVDSPIVINMNSQRTPSSLYVICIGFDG